MTAHAWAWEPAALAVPPAGLALGGATYDAERPPPPPGVWRPGMPPDAPGVSAAVTAAVRQLGLDGPRRRYAHGAWVCAACRVLQAFAATWDLDDDGQPGPCPGPPPQSAELPGASLGPHDPEPALFGRDEIPTLKESDPCPSGRSWT